MRRPALLTRAALALLLVLGLPLSGVPVASAVPGDPALLKSWDLDPELSSLFEDQQLAMTDTLGFNCSRIPALTTARNGWVVASWDGRPRNCADAPQPNSVLFSLSKDHGRTWNEIRILAQGTTGANQRGFSDPSFITDRETGRIFAFFVMSYDWAWPQRNNEVTSDRQVMHAVYFSSDDNGETWQGPTQVTDALNPEPRNQVWTGRFAASGEGIQLRYGPNAGRLIQQYVVYNKQTRQNLAVSLYSDDNGATWKAGEPVGPGMDENKVVELSDGRVMMNSRKSDGTGGRYVAYSADGGQTWSPRITDPSLIDPQNNASIIRAFPNAPMGSREAKILLFSNSAAGTRVNGTIRISYDDGATWPDSKVFEPGSMAYSTMTTLADGSLGMLYERQGSTIHFAKLTWAWLDGQGVTFSAASTPLHRGINEVEIAVNRSIGGELPAGKLKVSGPTGFTGTTVDVPAIPDGNVATVKVPITVADTVSLRNVTLSLQYLVNGSQINAGVQLPFVLRDGEVVHNPQLRVDLTRRSPLQEVYRPGDRIQYALRVESLATDRINAVPRAGVWQNLFPTCRWNNLAPGGNYTCGATTGAAAANPPTYTVTEADVERGWVEPEMVWAVATGGDTSGATPVQEIAFRADRTELHPVRIINRGPAMTPKRITVGTKLEYTFEYTNTSDRSYAVIPSAGPFSRFFGPGSPNCQVDSLGGGESVTCSGAEYTVTEVDVNRGTVQPLAAFKVANSVDAQALYELRVNASAVPVPTFTPILGVPTETAAGDTVRIKLTGFIPEERVQLNFNGQLVTELETDSTGTAEHLLLVPVSLEPGEYPVTAGQSDLSARAQLVVRKRSEPLVTQTPAPEKDEILIEPASPRPGHGFTARVSGFLPAEEVRLEVRSDPILLDTKRSDGQGSVSFSVVLPMVEAGKHHIVATGATSGKTVSYAFTVTAAENSVKLPGTGGVDGGLVAPLLVLAIAGAAIGWAVWQLRLKA